MLRSCALVGVARNRFPCPVRVGPPSQPRAGAAWSLEIFRWRCLGIIDAKAHDFGIENALAIPIPLAKHQPANSRGRARRERAASPACHQIQSIHLVCLPIADAPFLLLHSDRTVQTLLE